MFDLIAGRTPHAPRHQAAPLLISVALHGAVVAAVLAATLVFVVAPEPAERMMMAFVAAPPPPPPPPPAPAPPAPPPRADEPVRTSGDVAPLVVPEAISPEPDVPAPAAFEAAGVDGGVPGGIAGGVLGGIMADVPPPPPPLPPPPAPRAPVRIGGQIVEPTLIHRVEPIYPALAIARQLEGRVILEALVDEEGRVEDLKVLRSGGVFDNAAIDAVRQWRYSPVILNGRPEKFILTVVLSFTLR